MLCVCMCLYIYRNRLILTKITSNNALTNSFCSFQGSGVLWYLYYIILMDDLLLSLKPGSFFYKFRIRYGVADYNTTLKDQA